MHASYLLDVYSVFARRLVDRVNGVFVACAVFWPIPQKYRTEERWNTVGQDKKTLKDTARPIEVGPKQK